jgi:hypothetical protein
MTEKEFPDFSKPHICCKCPSQGTPEMPLVFNWDIHNWICPNCLKELESKIKQINKILEKFEASFCAASAGTCQGVRDGYARQIAALLESELKESKARVEKDELLKVQS